nr:immunoglobulin heavy chain junction region [Mus musculus]
CARRAAQDYFDYW